MTISVTPDKRITFGAGESLNVELQLFAGATVDDLAGRSAALTVFDRDRATVKSVAGEIKTDESGDYWAFGIAGAITTDWFGQTGYGYEIAEILDTGRDIIVSGKISIQVSAATVTADPSVVEGPSARFTATDIQGNRRILVSQRGAPGFSAAQQAYFAGVIDEPTEAALVAYLEEVGFNAVSPYATQAAASATAAQTARAGAEAAQDAAESAAQYRVSIAFKTYAGLAAVTGTANQSGAVFSDAGTHTDPVVGGTVNNLGLYRYSTSPAGWERVGNLESVDAQTAATAAANSAASAATTAAGLASVLYNDPLDPRQRVDFTDSEGNIFASFVEGDPTIGEIDAATQAAQEGMALESLAPPAIQFTDSDENVIATLTADDIAHPKIDAIDTATNAAKIRAWAAQVKAAGPAETDHHLRTTVAHFLKYGQSNSANTSDTMGLPAYPAPLTMFNGGIQTRRGLSSTATTATTGSTRTSFVAMQETGSETGMAAALSMMLKLATAWGADLSGGDMKLLGSGAGVGGVNISQLATTYFFRVEEDIAEAKAIADAANQSYSVAACLYNGNESNQSTATVTSYRDALRSMQVQIQTEAQSTSGQSWPVPMFIVQTNSHLSSVSASYYNVNAPVGLAHIEAGRNADAVNDNIIFCGPSYQFGIASDGVHFTMEGGAVRDALLGVGMFKVFFLGVKPQPLVPTITVFGDYYRLKFPIDPGRSLQWDTTTVPAQTNYGFRAFSSGGTARTIGTPRIIAHDTVEIFCAAAAAGDSIDYAIANTTGGTFGMGNLRDNQGDDIVTDRFGTRVDNWIPLFKETAA